MDNCICGKELGKLEVVCAGPSGIYCSMECVKTNLEATILSYTELLADLEAHFEEVDTESIGVKLASCGVYTVDHCKDCFITCEDNPQKKPQ